MFVDERGGQAERFAFLAGTQRMVRVADHGALDDAHLDAGDVLAAQALTAQPPRRGRVGDARDPGRIGEQHRQVGVGL